MTKNSLLVFLLLTGCGGDDGSDPTTTTTTTTTTSECIPSEEVCNGLDDDCDGWVDEDSIDGSTFYEDLDADGFGNPESTIISCEDVLDGYILDENTDCDDTTATTHPGADEYCDGVDNDCDNETDEDDAVDTTTWYADNDKDGFGDEDYSVVTCDAPKGWVADNTDCDDVVGNTYPGADEYCDGVDTDCDGIDDNDDAIGAPTWYADSDGDNFGDDATTAVACYESKGWTDDNTDCNDDDSSTYPDAPEYCDGVDSDCNSVLDDDYAMDSNNYYADIDSDGFGDEDNSYDACSPPAGYVEDNTDCDDTSDITYPGAPESCDGVDTDCNGALDDDYSLDALTWYADLDNDTYGDATNSTPSCSQPTGWVSDASDCDDSSSAVNPVADEWCNGVDNDCNGTVDDDYATDSVMWFADTDGDNYGDSTNTTEACYEAAGWLADSTDCDDSNDTIHPDADEYCDGLDTNCNSVLDDDYAVDANTYYADIDTDNYGDAYNPYNACSLPVGYVENDDDCNDSTAATYPGAPNYCNGIDNDCDGVTDPDDALDALTWFADTDGDNYGNASVSNVTCYSAAGWVSDNTDCNDTSNAVSPAASEYCNGVDDNCNGTIDDDYALDANTYFADTDNDSYGDVLNSYDSCSPPSGYVENNNDCDDTEGSTYPGADEYCNSVDNDCNTIVDDDYAVDANTYYWDSDSDTYGNSAYATVACSAPVNYVANDDDCDDTTGITYPGAPEVCDEDDNDCDGSTDEGVQNTYYGDTDGDGYGEAADSMLACDPPSGYVANDGDCNDEEPEAWIGHSEICKDGIDNDCDGGVDNGSDHLFYYDSDGDNYGDAAISELACEPSANYVDNRDDCDDDKANIHPGADEYCNSIDEDCNGNLADDYAVDALDWYDDYDGDTYGDATDLHRSCTAPSGHVSDDTDCNDSNVNAYPGADEWCNGVDNDCNGIVDDNYAVDVDTYYADNDSDGYGASSSGTYEACSSPSGYVANSTDCDDDRVYTNPGAYEFCNGIDDDCDGSDAATGVGFQYEASPGLFYDANNYTTFSTTVGSPSSPTNWEGDYFFCGNDTYYINWTISVDTTITGISGTTTLDGSGIDTVVYNNAGKDLTITNINIENGYSDGYGAGIYQYTGTLNLVDVDLRDNQSDNNGAGLYVFGANVSGDNLYFYNNDSYQHGGGLYANQSDVTLHDTYFSSNSAYSKGGGIRAYDADVVLTDTKFYSNGADEDRDETGGGSAIALADGASLDASTLGTGDYDCDFKYNWDYAEDTEAAVLIQDSTANFEDCNFYEDDSTYDNRYFDIHTADGGMWYEYDNASVSCDGDDCGSSLLAWHGAGGTAYEYSTSADKEFGNIYLADTTRTLNEMMFWIMTEYDCYPTFFVYESTTYNGTRTEVWSGTSTTATNGGTEEYYMSPTIGIPVTSGRYYTLTMDVDTAVCGDLDYTYSSSIYSSSSHFGAHVGSFTNGSVNLSSMYYTTISSRH